MSERLFEETDRAELLEIFEKHYTVPGPEEDPEYDLEALLNGLAAVARKAAEKAWDQAMDDLNGEGFLNEAEHEMFTAWHNPYRRGGSDE